MKVGELFFAPGQHPHRIDLLLVETLAELQAIVARWGDPTEPEPAINACCCFDFDGANGCYGFIIFAREKLTPAIVVHECTHAGLHFVGQISMHSAAVVAMSEEERQSYYDEACATVVEQLFDQAEKLISVNWRANA